MDAVAFDHLDKSFGAVAALRDVTFAVAGKMPANPIIDSGVDVVTAANVDRYVIGWKAFEKQ